MATPEISLRDRIRKNYHYLVSELLVTSYVNALFQEGALSIEEKEQLSGICSRKEQAECFVDIMMRKPDKSIQKFFDIVRTQTDKQPHIYAKLFPDSLSSEQDQRAQQLDGSNESVSRRAHEFEAAARSDPIGYAQWEKVVIPHRQTLLDALRPTLLLDRLRAAHLLTQREYDQLQQESGTERDRPRKLLDNILPCKMESLKKFCRVLQVVEGQQHLVPEILRLHVSVGTAHHLEVKQIDDSYPGNMSTTLNSSEKQASTLDLQQATVEQASRTARKEEQESLFSAKQRKTDRVAFFFKPELLGCIKDLKAAVRSMCAECFGISKEKVLFASAETTEMIERWKEDDVNHPVYVDSKSLLLVLLVEGINPNDILEAHRSQLQLFIVEHLKDYDPDLEISGCKFIEVLPYNSSFIYIVLQLSINLFVHLLFALSERAMLRVMSNSLRKILPEATMAVLRLGGLPPLQLFNGQANAQNLEHRFSVFDVGDATQELTENQRSEVTLEATRSRDHGNDSLKLKSDSLDEKRVGSNSGLGQLLDEKTLDQCPTFFDTAGFSANDRVPEAKLLSTIASGRLPENTDLREILTPHFNHKEWLSSLTQNKELQCWSILLVVRADKDFSREIAKVCYQAWEILEKSLNDVRMFAIVTGLDKIKPESKNVVWREMEEKLTTILRIPPTRVSEVRNFTVEDKNEDGTLKVDKEQRKFILRAMIGILSPDQMPWWKSQETTATASAH